MYAYQSTHYYVLLFIVEYRLQRHTILLLLLLPSDEIATIEEKKIDSGGEKIKSMAADIQTQSLTRHRVHVEKQSHERA